MSKIAAQQQLLLYVDDGTISAPVAKVDVSSTFQDNMSLPVHRWFRYSAGFSASWVQTIIEQEKANGRGRVLDPFAGSGTVPLQAEFAGVEAFGVEAHPFVSRMARAKLRWRESVKVFKNYAEDLLARARAEPLLSVACPPLLVKCYPSEILIRLYALKRAWAVGADDSPLSELAWAVLVSILRECSPVGTAQWQYVLPNKIKAKVRDPFEAFHSKVLIFCRDMEVCQSLYPDGRAVLLAEDARLCSGVPDGWADLVITSPPYANNYDYADATRLEMTFMGDVQGWGDLQDTVRKYLIRSCTQHVAPIMSETDSLLADEVLQPIRHELAPICGELGLLREERGGKKPYHTMLVAYFADLSRVWRALRRTCSPGARVCFVIGDSAPYGVYVPVDRWLGELALAAGFKSFRFEKTRDRNIKWKNRKHRVPLHEGRLWVEG